jgi:hypothetical protein
MGHERVGERGKRCRGWGRRWGVAITVVALTCFALDGQAINRSLSNTINTQYPTYSATL